MFSVASVSRTLLSPIMCPTQHPEHLRSGTLDEGNAGKQSRPQVERQDRLCRFGQVLLSLGNDMVEIADDCAEHPEAPKVVFAGYRRWNASHQEKPSNVGWRCPGSDIRSTSSSSSLSP